MAQSLFQPSIQFIFQRDILCIYLLFLATLPSQNNVEFENQATHMESNNLTKHITVIYSKLRVYCSITEVQGICSCLFVWLDFIYLQLQNVEGSPVRLYGLPTQQIIMGVADPACCIQMPPVGVLSHEKNTQSHHMGRKPIAHGCSLKYMFLLVSSFLAPKSLLRTIVNYLERE